MAGWRYDLVSPATEIRVPAMSERVVCIVAAIGFCAIAGIFLFLPDCGFVRDCISHIDRWPEWARAQDFGFVVLLIAAGFLWWGWRATR